MTNFQSLFDILFYKTKFYKQKIFVTKMAIFLMLSEISVRKHFSLLNIWFCKFAQYASKGRLVIAN